MVIGVVGEERAKCGPVTTEQVIGDPESEQVAIETRHLGGARGIEAEVAEAPYIERSLAQDATHVIAGHLSSPIENRGPTR